VCSDDSLLLELLTRKKRLLGLKRSLTDWCIACGYQPAIHHALIIDRLEKLARREGKTKLMIAMPPGSAKSTYGSVLFPPWYLANNPRHSVLAASHSMELAERWGRRVRNLIEERSFDLGIATSHGNRAAGRWQLAPKGNTEPHLMGEYLAAGSGTAIAGFRGDLGVIDDPVSGRESVASEAQRNSLWDWYVFDFRPRLKPGAAQLLIMTRWHEDDLTGRILEEEGDEWDQLILPMLAEANDDPLGRAFGERLWSEWFTDEMVATAMRDPALWLSLYQQRPTHEEGTFWRKDWLHAVPPAHVPPRSTMRIYGGSDYAVSADRGDYTVHLVIGLDPDDRPWLLEVWRAQATSEVWVDQWCQIVKFWKPMTWAEEQGQIISGVGPWLERASHKAKAYTERLQFPSRFDKGTRAQSIRGHIATHGLWYANDLPGRSQFEAELLAFPNGRHDDQHDALGLIGQLLDAAIHGKNPKPPDKKKIVGYKPLTTPAGKFGGTRHM
jgi:predicted phage terminase large subunit-like protein